MGEADVAKTESSVVKVSRQEDRKRRLPIIFVILGIAIVITIIVGLTAAGIVYVGVKSSSQRVTLQTRVCDGNDVLSYNSALGFDSDSGATKAKQTLTELANSIKARDGNDLDPTCLYILWQYAYLNGDKQSQKSYLSKLLILNNEGSYASGEIKSLDNIDTLQTLTNEIKTAEQKGQG